jgi:hypothetical protein
MTEKPTMPDLTVLVQWMTVAGNADGLVERVNAFLDIDRARAAAERLAQERE